MLSWLGNFQWMSAKTQVSRISRDESERKTDEQVARQNKQLFRETRGEEMKE